MSYGGYTHSKRNDDAFDRQCNEKIKDRKDKERKELERLAEIGRAVKWYISKYDTLPIKTKWDDEYNCWYEKTDIEKTIEAYRKAQGE